MKKIKVTQIRSQIGRIKKHKDTLEGLGLRRIGQSREHKLTPQLKGMLDKVNYLVSVEEIK